MNGDIYQGFNGTSGDAGHMVADPKGAVCYCGRRGCLEAVAGQQAILQWAKSHIERHGGGDFHGIMNTAEDVTIANVYKALRDGNRLLLDRLQESAGYVGRVLCDLVRLLDPEKIVIGGKLLEVSPEFMDMVKLAYRAEQPGYAAEAPEIVPSSLGEHSVAVGAAMLMISELFKAQDLAAV